MGEPIEIDIKTKYDGAGASRAKKDIDELSTGKNSPAAPATATARAEEAQHGDRRLSVEKAITKEKEKQAAGAKAQAGHGGGGFATARMIGELGDMAGGQGMVMKAMQVQRIASMVAEGGVIGTALAVIAPFAAYAAAKALKINAADKQVALLNQSREERGAFSDHMSRIGRFGTSEEAFSAELDKQDELKALKRHHETLVDQANSGFIGHIAKSMGSDFFTKGAGFFKPQSALDLQRNEMQQSDTEQEAKEAAEKKKEWWNKIGKRQIEIQKAMASGHMAEARGIQDEVTAIEEAKRLDAAGASPEEIKEGVTAKLQNVQRERAGQLGRLVTGRDGAADTARVAREAQSFRSAGRAEDILERVHSTMVSQHTETINTATQKDFTQR